MSPGERKIDVMVRGFSRRLGITQRVIVSIVPANSRLASVECIRGATRDFLILFEARFLRTLDDRELGAALAHELGHVWIFTHFPYLQTEELANQQALKLVSSQDLSRIYEKVRRWNEIKSDAAAPLDAGDKSGGPGGGNIRIEAPGHDRR
jgi:hypothetical protein